MASIGSLAFLIFFCFFRDIRSSPLSGILVYPDEEAVVYDEEVNHEGLEEAREVMPTVPKSEVVYHDEEVNHEGLEAATEVLPTVSQSEDKDLLSWMDEPKQNEEPIYYQSPQEERPEFRDAVVLLNENIRRTIPDYTKKSEPENQNVVEDSTTLESEGQTTIVSDVSCTDVASPEELQKRYALAVFFKANWFRASQYCKYRGMQLATIDSESEQQMLESALGKIGFDLGAVWTSGTDMAEEGKFFWMSTGTPVTYTKWFPGEPNGKKPENCVEVFRASEGYFWNDRKCDQENHFVCEYYGSVKTEALTYV